MFGTLGMPELILIFVVALLLFGPRKMPQIGRSIGRAMGEFRRASNEFKRTIEDEVAAELNGVPTTWLKLLAYAMGAAFASVVGAPA